MSDSEMSKDKDAIERFKKDMNSIKDNWYKDCTRTQIYGLLERIAERTTHHHFSDLLSIKLLTLAIVIDLRRRNDADPRKQGGARGSVLKYVTDGDNVADEEDAHSGECKYATRR